jgi:hypothetical protein
MEETLTSTIWCHLDSNFSTLQFISHVIMSDRNVSDLWSLLIWKVEREIRKRISWAEPSGLVFIVPNARFKWIDKVAQTK